MTNRTNFKIIRKGVVKNKAVAINEVANDTVLYAAEPLYDFDVKAHRRQTKRELLKLAYSILDYFKASYTNLHARNKRHEYYVKNAAKYQKQALEWDRKHPEAKRQRNKTYRERHRSAILEKKRENYRFHAKEINARRRAKRRA